MKKKALINLLEKNRVKRKLTYQQLALLTNIERTNIYNVLNGKTVNPHIDTIFAIMDALGLSIEVVKK